MNAHHHRRQENAGEGGVVMVGGDMLCRRSFSLYGHVEDEDGKSECRRHGSFVLSVVPLQYCRSYRYLLTYTTFLHGPYRGSSYTEPTSSGCNVSFCLHPQLSLTRCIFCEISGVPFNI